MFDPLCVRAHKEKQWVWSHTGRSDFSFWLLRISWIHPLPSISIDLAWTLLSLLLYFCATREALYFFRKCLKTQGTAYHSHVQISGLRSRTWDLNHKLFPQHSRLLQSNPTLRLRPLVTTSPSAAAIPDSYVPRALICPLACPLPSVARGQLALVSRISSDGCSSWSRPVLAS